MPIQTSTSTHTRTRVYIYIYIYIYIYKQKRISVSIYLSIYTTDKYICMKLSVFIYLSIYLSIWPESNTQQNIRCMTTYMPSQKTFKWDEQDTRETVGELIRDLLLWTPIRGHASVGRPARTYLHLFRADAGCSLKNMSEVMEDRNGLREGVRVNLCY